MSIEVKNLTKRYSDINVVSELNFKTQSNQIIGFLGPNGAGKSTTMKMLAGVLMPTVGSILVNNIDVINNPIAAKCIIGFLPEENPLYKDMYIREVLSFEADLYKIKNKGQRINQVLELTALDTEQNKKVYQLSKGYKQRLGLARAIIHDPEVLILDEPTSGLDPNQIIEIRNLIRTLSVNKTVFLSTHIMQEVEAICDEIIVINKGELKDHFLKRDSSISYPELSMEEIFVTLTK